MDISILASSNAISSLTRQGIEPSILRFLLEPIALALEVVAIGFVVYGAIVVTVFLVKSEVRDVRRAGRKEHGILIQFTSRLLTALQFLIAADIVRTVIDPSIDTMIQLAFVVGIRIALAVILNRELAAEKEDLEKNDRIKNLDQCCYITTLPIIKEDSLSYPCGQCIKPSIPYHT